MLQYSCNILQYSAIFCNTPMKNKSCPNELQLCEFSRNQKSIKCWKFQLAILTNKKKYCALKICDLFVIETSKSKISDFLNSNTCFCSRLKQYLILSSFIRITQPYEQTINTTFFLSLCFHPKLICTRTYLYNNII